MLNFVVHVHLLIIIILWYYFVQVVKLQAAIKYAEEDLPNSKVRVQLKGGGGVFPPPRCDSLSVPVDSCRAVCQ